MTPVEKPLFHPIEQKNFNLFQNCIDEEGNVLSSDCNGCMVLHDAVICDEKKVVDCVLNTLKKTHGEAILHINLKNPTGDTPLMRAIKYRKMEIAHLLLQNEASIYLRNNEGMTAFHCAIKNGQHLGFFNVSIKEQIKLARRCCRNRFFKMREKC